MSDYQSVVFDRVPTIENLVTRSVRLGGRPEPAEFDTSVSKSTIYDVTITESANPPDFVSGGLLIFGEGMTRISPSNGIVAFDDCARVRITRVHQLGLHEGMRSLDRVLNGRPTAMPPVSNAGPSAASREAFRDELRAARPVVAPEPRAPEPRALHLDIAPPSPPGFDDPPPPYSPPGVSAPYLPASSPPPYTPGEMFEAPPLYLPPGVEGVVGEAPSPGRGRLWRAIMRIAQRD